MTDSILGTVVDVDRNVIYPGCVYCRRRTEPRPVDSPSAKNKRENCPHWCSHCCRIFTKPKFFYCLNLRVCGPEMEGVSHIVAFDGSDECFGISATNFHELTCSCHGWNTSGCCFSENIDSSISTYFVGRAFHFEIKSRKSDGSLIASRIIPQDKEIGKIVDILNEFSLASGDESLSPVHMRIPAVNYVPESPSQPMDLLTNMLAKTTIKSKRPSPTPIKKSSHRLTVSGTPEWLSDDSLQVENGQSSYLNWNPSPVLAAKSKRIATPLIKSAAKNRKKKRKERQTPMKSPVIVTSLDSGSTVVVAGSKYQLAVPSPSIFSPAVKKRTLIATPAFHTHHDLDSSMGSVNMSGYNSLRLRLKARLDVDSSSSIGSGGLGGESSEYDTQTTQRIFG